MLSRHLAIFKVGTKAVVIDQISHWWVAPGALSGPELCISMRNGKQINLGCEDGPSGEDGYAIEKVLVQTILDMGFV